MFTRRPDRGLFVLVLLTVAVLACACSGASPTSGPATPVAVPLETAPAGVTPPAVTATPAGPPPTHGSGSFDLPDPVTGLAGLGAYQATLHLTFDGQPAAWSQVMTMTVERQPGLQLLEVAVNPLPTGMPAELGDWMTGAAGGVHYTRYGAHGLCTGAADTTPLELPQPAQLLPAVFGAEPAGAPETIAGIATRHYRFDERAVSAAGRAQAAGDVWIASEGGFVVRYTLHLQGGPDYFGADTQGTQTWEYDLAKVNAPAAISLPAGCPPAMPDLPLPDDATDVQREPGALTFLTGLSPQDVAAFYISKLPALGWQPSPAKPPVTRNLALLLYRQDDRQLTVDAQLQDGGSAVMLTLRLGAPPFPTVTPAPTEAADAHLDELIEDALDVTLGTRKHPSPFPSYHLVLKGALPSWDGDHARVATATLDLAADVAGDNVHFFDSGYTDTPPASPHEYYVIGEDGFEVVNGKAQMSFTAIGVWSFWPLDVQFPLSVAALGPTPQGSVDFDGRTADAYALDTADADRMVLAALQQVTHIKAARGTIWIDHETNALLKLVLDYDQELLAKPGGPVAAIAPGHIEIAVTQVGQVTVTPPSSR